MADVKVRKLTLKLSGLDERDGQRLSREIAEGLAAADLEAVSSRRIGAIQKVVTGSPSDGVDRLAKQIVIELARSIERAI
jgi:microcystin degradation protein MlrC